MKKILQRLAVASVALLTFFITLYLVSSAASFAAFYISLAGTDTNACTRYYEGESKGIFWKLGEWHHYVDFKVDISRPREQWKLADAPLPTTILRYPSPAPDVIRANYRWPSNWQDPFPLNSWRICLLDS